MRRLSRSAVLLLVAACGHGDSFRFGPPLPSGPFSTSVPRQLTYYPLTDRTPSVFGAQLVFSRQSDAEPGSYIPNVGREHCIAFMPLAGGTITRQLCPDVLLRPADTLVDTWTEPVVSPDGRRLAFMWQRGTRVSALGLLDAYLMVTPLDQPTDTAGFRQIVHWFQPGTPNAWQADVATRLTWVNDATLRYLATYEHIIKVKGGGSERVTDTLYRALALLEADVTTGVAHLVPGGDSVIAYAPRADGSLWVVVAADSSALLRLDPATGARTPVGRFAGAVTELIAVDGTAVAVTGAGNVEQLDPAVGLPVVLDSSGLARRLAAAGGKRFVVEREQAAVPFGAPSDLWLFEVP